MKLDIWGLISTAHPFTLFFSGVILAVGIYKGIVKIPWLNWPRKNKKEPCVECTNVKYFNETISKNIEISIEVARIKFVETIKYQMIEAEIIYIEMADILKDNYWNEATKAGLTNGTRETSVAYYNLMIDNMESNVMDIIRGWMKSNHFIEKTEIEFQSYIDDKIKILIPKISNFIDHGFNRTVLQVDMHELHESALKCMDRIGALANTFFHKARAISIEKKKLIDKLNKPGVLE